MSKSDILHMLRSQGGEADVLHLHVGEPRTAVDFDESTEGTTFAGTRAANSSASRSSMLAGTSSVRAGSRSRCRNSR
jgi:hypothetical protein